MAFREAATAKRLGENDMPEYTDVGVGSNLLALSQIVRGGETRHLVDEIISTRNPQDMTDLLVLIFATRNTRGGKGEKKLAYDMFLRVYNKALPETCLRLLKLFSHYGYWKDLLHLVKMIKGDPLVPKAKKEAFFNQAIKIMSDQLVADIRELEQAVNNVDSPNPSISLLAKWLPREGASLDKSTGVVDALATGIFTSAGGDGAIRVATPTSNGNWQSHAKRKYRKVIAQLTAHLALPEVLLAAHREEEIQFGRIASRATFRLRYVFMNEDKEGKVKSDDPKRKALAERFLEYALEKGLKGSQLMPHEIVRKILSGKVSTIEELVLDAQWKSLRESVVAQMERAADENSSVELSRMIPLSDVSGSMYGVPMEVSIALGIFLSEITHPAFQHLVLTFESTPTWHRLPRTGTIVAKVKSLEAAGWGGSTDFIEAYRLILEVANKNNLKKSDVPGLVVFSDMQFDEAHPEKNGKIVHEILKEEFKETAAVLGWEDSEPTPIIYWNLRNTGGHPVERDTDGAVMLSGFSPSLLKLVMTGKVLEDVEVEVVDVDGNVTTEKVRVTPEVILRKMVDDQLYDPVRSILASGEGFLEECKLTGRTKPT